MTEQNLTKHEHQQHQQNQTNTGYNRQNLIDSEQD